VTSLFKIRINSIYRITGNCKVFEFAQLYQLTTLRLPLNADSGQLSNCSE